MILLCQCQKTLTLVCRRFSILMLQNCIANEFRAFLCLCLSQRERKLLLFLGVCDWYTLLKSPDNMVSISSTILWSKVILCDRASCVCVSFSLLTRPWSSCEPNTQSKQISSSPPCQYQDSEHQADYFLHYWPGRSQVPDIVTGQGSPTAAQQALSTKSSSHKS